MKTLSRLLLIFLFVAEVHNLRSEEKQRDPFAEPTPEEAAEDAALIEEMEPDHLTPVDTDPGEWHVAYSKLLGKKLDLDSPFFLRMMVCPSFSAENVVSLEAEPGDGRTLEAAEKLVLRYSIGDKSIWYSMPDNNDGKEQKEVKVETLKVPFPSATGIRLNKVWNRMIRATRVPEQGSGGLDGVTYEFATRGGKGEAWSPMSKKSPGLFVELGGSLIDYCRVKEEDRKEAMKVVEERLEALEKYLDKPPVKK